MKGPAAKKQANDPFVLMVKPVGARCNLACEYCYYSEPPIPGQKPLPLRIMSREVLETVILRYIEASPVPAISFTWHGGEPTLAGLNFYRQVVKLQKRHLPKDWLCWNSLQTNGMLLDDDWCSFLAENRFDVGLSIDGVTHVHDLHRKDRGGGATHQLAVDAVRRLQAHGIQPDLLCTVTSSAAEDPLTVYRMLRELQTGWLQFIPIVRRDDQGVLTPDSVTAAGYGHFLCTIFDEWLAHDVDILGVQLFAEMMLVAAGNSANLCWMAPTCGRALVVERDGSIYSCDHFVNPKHRLGNIRSSALKMLVDSPTQRRFGNAKRDLLPATCTACPWLSFCHGGCPKDRFATAPEGEGRLNTLCDGLRQFFAHSAEALTNQSYNKKRLAQSISKTFSGNI